MHHCHTSCHNQFTVHSWLVPTVPLLLGCRSMILANVRGASSSHSASTSASSFLTAGREEDSCLQCPGSSDHKGDNSMQGSSQLDQCPTP